MKLQADYARKTYEGLVTETSKIGGLYADMASQATSPSSPLSPGEIAARRQSFSGAAGPGSVAQQANLTVFQPGFLLPPRWRA